MSTPVQLATIDSTGVKVVGALLFPAGKVAGAASTVTGGTVPGTTTIGAGATAIYMGLTETPAGSGQYKVMVTIAGTVLPDTDPGLPYTVEARVVAAGTDMTSYAAIASAYAASAVINWSEEPTPNMAGGILIAGAWGAVAASSDGTGGGGIVFVTPIMASTTNPRYSTRDLPPIAQGSSPVDVVSVTSGSGAPVGLTGRTLRLVAYLVADDKGTDTRYDDTLAPAFMYETADGGLTIGGPSGNEVSIHHDPDKTAKPGEYRYFLWDITDLVAGKGGIVLMKGKYPIEPAVRSLVAA
jgi:hypothetical protein